MIQAEQVSDLGSSVYGTSMLQRMVMGPRRATGPVAPKVKSIKVRGFL